MEDQRTWLDRKQTLEVRMLCNYYYSALCSRTQRGARIQVQHYTTVPIQRSVLRRWFQSEEITTFSYRKRETPDRRNNGPMSSRELPLHDLLSNDWRLEFAQDRSDTNRDCHDLASGKSRSMRRLRNDVQTVILRPENRRRKPSHEEMGRLSRIVSIKSQKQTKK